uniref:Peptidase M11 gametolysin domain-containing protein n=1 Tax=Noctiluca scintillans TaxID=2966 RepID=A0A7S0ZUF2_NOCSC
MEWISWRLLLLSLDIGFALALMSPQHPSVESFVLQARHDVDTRRLSVECVLTIFESDEFSSSPDACEYRFGMCASGEIMYYIRDDSPSDVSVLETIVPGSTVRIDLEEVDVTEVSHCTTWSPWRPSGSPVYRAISATPVGGVSLSETGLVSTFEMDVLMIVVRIPNTSNPWVESEIWEDLVGPGVSINNLFSHSSNGQMTVPASSAKLVTVDLTSDWVHDWDTVTSCPVMQMNSDLFAAVQAEHDINPDDYTFREIFIPEGGGCVGWGGTCSGSCGHPKRGWPSAGACIAWYKVKGVGVRAHVLGHNLGLVHAGGPGDPYHTEDGDLQNMMGNGAWNSTVPFIPSDRYFLGFLSELPGEMVEWTDDSSSPVLLSSTTVELGAGGADAVAVKIECDECRPKVGRHMWKRGGNLWVYFRGEESIWADEVVDSKYRQKVFVHLDRPYLSEYISGGSELWAILSEGETYDMPYTDFSLQFCEIIGNTSYISITKDYHNCPTPAPTPAPTYSRSYIRRVRSLCKNPKRRKQLTEEALELC